MMIIETLTDKQMFCLKAGDKVWISSGHGRDRDHIEVVKRTTATRILLGEGGEFDIFWRVPRGRWTSCGRQTANLTFRRFITYMATPEEWNAQVATEKARKADQKKREDEKTDRERKQNALQLAFQGQPGIYVNTHDFGNTKSWSVSINDLTGQQVRDLARVLGGCWRTPQA